MNRLLFLCAFGLGAVAVLWMASTFVGSDVLALTVTLVIGAVYGLGFLELLQFRRATATLDHALAHVPAYGSEAGSASIDDWLGRLDPSLQNSVRLRIEGERVGLPAPVITPYLVGLLVMLGLLGTFIGMVDTLRGAVFALEGTTELQAIREGLAAPISGLSLAFGTSVAGVAASAMLGLIATLSRRDRMLVTRQLDRHIATDFRGFSLVHNRQETYRALQLQAHALPEVAQQLTRLAHKLEDMGDRLAEQLLANQGQFHDSVRTVYTELATAVDSSLRDSLADSGRLAGESIKPLVAEALTTICDRVEDTHKQLSQAAEDTRALISQSAQDTHQQLAGTAKEHLETLGSHFGDTARDVSSAWQAGLAAHKSANDAMIAGMGESLTAFSRDFSTQASDLLASFNSGSSDLARQQATAEQERLAQWIDSLTGSQEQAGTHLLNVSKTIASELKMLGEHQQAAFQTATRDFESLSNALGNQWQQAGERVDQLATSLGGELKSLRDEEERRSEAAVVRMAQLEATVASHLATLGKELEAPMARLIETASETPRAAAEVIDHLRREISNTIERDNSLLEERSQLMEQLTALAAALANNTASQRDAIEQLVRSSEETLADISSRFGGQLEAELGKMSDAAANFAGGATEMASLGEAFTLAVNLFSEANGSMIESLQRIEESLDKSSNRSDEQMGYYVAQAREIIDQSMLSQRELFEELRELSPRDSALAAGAS